eukprot:scaffold282602_cov40-Attheya_sp.AAC.1
MQFRRESKTPRATTMTMTMTTRTIQTKYVDDTDWTGSVPCDSFVRPIRPKRDCFVCDYWLHGNGTLAPPDPPCDSTRTSLDPNDFDHYQRK